MRYINSRFTYFTYLLIGHRRMENYVSCLLMLIIIHTRNEHGDQANCVFKLPCHCIHTVMCNVHALYSLRAKSAKTIEIGTRIEAN